MRRLPPFARRLARARDGVAVVDVGLRTTVFCGIVTVALDFAAYAQQKLRLGEAVEQGATLAFNTRDAVNPATIAGFVTTTAGLSDAPAITCNGGTCVAAGSRGATDYRCVDQATGAIGATAYAQGASCTGGGNAGYYLKIVATRKFKPLAVPDRWLGTATLTQTVIVRLA